MILMTKISLLPASSVESTTPNPLLPGVVTIFALPALSNVMPKLPNVVHVVQRRGVYLTERIRLLRSLIRNGRRRRKRMERSRAMTAVVSRSRAWRLSSPMETMFPRMTIRTRSNTYVYVRLLRRIVASVLRFCSFHNVDTFSHPSDQTRV